MIKSTAFSSSHCFKKKSNGSRISLILFVEALLHKATLHPKKKKKFSLFFSSFCLPLVICFFWFPTFVKQKPTVMELNTVKRNGIQSGLTLENLNLFKSSKIIEWMKSILQKVTEWRSYYLITFKGNKDYLTIKRTPPSTKTQEDYRMDRNRHKLNPTWLDMWAWATVAWIYYLRFPEKHAFM